MCLDLHLGLGFGFGIRILGFWVVHWEFDFDWGWQETENHDGEVGTGTLSRGSESFGGSDEDGEIEWRWENGPAFEDLAVVKPLIIVRRRRDLRFLDCTAVSNEWWVLGRMELHTSKRFSIV